MGVKLARARRLPLCFPAPLRSAARRACALGVVAWLLAALAVLVPETAAAAHGGAASPAGAVASADAVVVVDGRATIALWPAVTVLFDPEHALDVGDVLARRGDFAPPRGTAANLGRVADTVWLRVPLHVAGDATVERVLDVDYASLNHVDAWVVADGRVVAHHRMGNALRADERAWASRAHSAPLLLAPGDQELVLRVRTHSTMALPLTLRTYEGHVRAESAVQLVQGAIFGLGVWMLLYSLFHGISLRDPMFADYALMLGGNVLFVLTYLGIGAQYLWPDWPELSTRLAPAAVLVAIAASSRFVDAALKVGEISRALSTGLTATRWAALATLAAMVAGVLDYRAGQSLATAFGVLVPTMMLPVAWVRARHGDIVALYMLAGWAVYAVAVGITAALLRGLVEPTFLTLHVYAFGALGEMSAWLAVLSLRVQAVHRDADRARVESEAMRTLAQTDSLTGLANRRGLLAHLAADVPQAMPQPLLALYLLDLDGFKPVNDRYGHDVGDALLVAVGERLRHQVRSSDFIARLGGDEFVVVARGLADEAAAQRLGAKVLDTFATPFTAAGRTCSVGASVGYALAPFDGTHADELLQCADAAMYAGKSAGGRPLRRGVAPAPA